MARNFDSFVILADMRTGSNALEERLNDYAGLTSHGELFNPGFIGKPGTEALFGLTLKERDADPLRLIEAVQKATKGLAGFRLFSDHDPRMLDHVLSDRKTAKIILTRDPLDSYVSLKIARATNQWWLGDLKRAKSEKARFVPDEFEAYLAGRAAHLGRIRHRLKSTGQVPFEIRYEELGDADVIAGLARFLGAKDLAEETTQKGRVQNPVPLSEKVVNPAEMKAALEARAPVDLDAVPDFEPPRGPNVPSFLASRRHPLLYMPVKCAADLVVEDWLAALDGGPAEALETGFTQRKLRGWKRTAGTHLSFTVVAHPVARAHEAFCRFILPTGDGAFTGIRSTLRRSYGVPLPEDPADPGFDTKAHGAAFLAFLRFLKGNLSGQTAIRIDGAWASQTATVQGISSFGPPDRVLRAEDLEAELAAIAARLGADAPPLPHHEASFHGLDEIYSGVIERAARRAYQKDYMMFGYGPWRAG
ncbi:nodulation protein NodH [Ovoidimarina sediminis]|uniref:nodulation protein NodH n=1 Tax=Ovoidimarina sediminis TaxID=3079856 RepID=UPI00290DDF77|nr:nodulation protein NodH [Rhodophyticola sp. MJ-SS7]MDU8942396.1 nodulation protein NodH [Rhodophyticola sp. MJ-SS7]